MGCRHIVVVERCYSTTAAAAVAVVVVVVFSLHIKQQLLNIKLLLNTYVNVFVLSNY